MDSRYSTSTVSEPVALEVVFTSLGWYFVETLKTGTTIPLNTGDYVDPLPTFARVSFPSWKDTYNPITYPVPRGVRLCKPRRRDHMHDHHQRRRHKRRAFVQALARSKS